MPIYQYVRYIGSTLAVSVDGGLVKDALAGVRGDQYLMARLSICSAADLLMLPHKKIFMGRTTRFKCLVLKKGAWVSEPGSTDSA